MPVLDTGLVVMGNALDAVLTHAQLSNGDPGTSGTANAVGTRVATSATVDADGDLTFPDIPFTGLTANQAVTHVTFWTSAGTGSPATGGTCHVTMPIPAGAPNDATANAAGAYTVKGATVNIG